MIDLKNASLEFLMAVHALPRIQCAFIQRDYFGETQKYILKIGYSESGYQDFIKSLDFEYTDDLLGSVIWLEDGTWLDREEDDVNQYWAYRRTPAIPVECL